MFPYNLPSSLNLRLVLTIKSMFLILKTADQLYHALACSAIVTRGLSRYYIIIIIPHPTIQYNYIVNLIFTIVIQMLQLCKLHEILIQIRLVKSLQHNNLVDGGSIVYHWLTIAKQAILPAHDRVQLSLHHIQLKCFKL